MTALRAAGSSVTLVRSTEPNPKLTWSGDVPLLESLLLARQTPANRTRVGLGFDLHRLAEGRPCILGGIELPHPTGPVGHSDGDAVLHAVADAVLGAAGLDDLGTLFPDTDPDGEGADSRQLLGACWERVVAEGWTSATSTWSSPPRGRGSPPTAPP